MVIHVSFCPNCEDSLLQTARSATDVKKKVLKCMICGYENDDSTHQGTCISIKREKKDYPPKTNLPPGMGTGRPNKRHTDEYATK